VRDRRSGAPRTGFWQPEIRRTLGRSPRETGKPFDKRVTDEITIGLAIAMLSRREQQVTALGHIEDATEKDTAARMNVQPGAVKRYRSDAVKKIQAALAGTHDIKAQVGSRRRRPCATEFKVFARCHSHAHQLHR